MRRFSIQTSQFFKKFIFTSFERQRDGERIPLHWFTPQMVPMAGAGSGQSQEPRTQSGSLMWVTGIQVLEPSSANSRVHISRKLEWKQRSLDLNPGASTCGAGIPNGILTTVPHACPLIQTFKFEDGSQRDTFHCWETWGRLIAQVLAKSEKW